MPESVLPDFRGPRRSRRQRSTKENVRGGCFVAVGVVVFAGLLTVALVFAPTADTTSLTDTRKTVARQTLDQAERNTQDLQEAAKAGQKREGEVVLTEDAINLMLIEKANATSGLAAHGLSDPTVRISGGKMTASAKRAVGSLAITLAVDLKPRVAADGGVRFDVSGLSLGRLSIPASIAQRLADEVADALGARAAKNGLTVVGAAVVGNELKLRVRTRPGGPVL
ncbi:MAG: hypothetical protein NT029_08905 [Armatimonadetes bacterium]|nr:hypothetical protein [Armatimonadota bacterium]